MMRFTIKACLCYGISILLFAACAQQVAPTGGPKDVEGPEVVNIEPKNAKLNYQNETIKIDFNEFVQLQQLKKELLISPPLKHDIKTQIRGKSLLINIEDSLKENTTYVLNFGEAIVDITENNPITDFQYVFSTGDELDSLEVSGRLVNAYTLKVEPEVTVMLHQEHENDSIIAKKRPDYISRTDEEGRFVIRNIKEGRYQIYALKDKNNNFRYDAEESIAFHNEVLDVKDSSTYDSLKLYLFNTDVRLQYVDEQSESGPHIELKFKSPLTDFNYQLLDTTSSVLKYHSISKDRKTANLWFNEMPQKKLQMAVKDDTLYNDTLNFKIDSLNKKDNFTLAQALTKTQAYYKAYEIKFNRPVASLNQSKIQFLKQDSSEVDFDYQLIQDSTYASIFYLDAAFQEDSSYILNIIEGAFTDLYGSTNDSLSQTFTVDGSNQYSQLNVKVIANTSLPMVLELMDKEGKVLRSFSVEGETIEISHLKAGTYALRLIFDRNDNQKWDRGDYYKGQFPEKVWIYEEEIKLRENWDREIKWVIKN